MRALILSDIHSNIDALEAVLDAAPPYDVIWNLGDVVGYNAAPQMTIDRVKRLGEIFVRGNHDRACCGLLDLNCFNPIARAAAQWTIRQIEPEAIEWLKAMPKGPAYIPAAREKAGPSIASAAANENFTRDDKVIEKQNSHAISCVHGSPLDEDEYLLSAWDAAPALASAKSHITFFGHTHVQGGYAGTADRDTFAIRPGYSSDDTTESYDLNLRDSATYLINPGSVGQPRDRDWRAAFALYDSNAGRVTYGRVPYDVRIAQMRIQRAGLPDALAARLRVGR